MILLVDSKGPDQAAQIVHICLKTHFRIARSIYDHYHIDTLERGKSLAPAINTVEPRYLELAYFELPLISKWKSGPCFNMKLSQQVTK